MNPAEHLDRLHQAAIGAPATGTLAEAAMHYKGLVESAQVLAACLGELQQLRVNHAELQRVLAAKNAEK